MKQVCHGGFFEYANAQYLENLVKRSFAMQPFLKDGHQRVDAHCYPKLGANRVVASSIKVFDAQVLLEPTEKQFDLPALLIESGDRQAGKPK